MNPKDQLNEVRGGIDRVDAEMLKLLRERMELSDRIADVKRAGNLGITDEARERQVMERAADAVPEEFRADALVLMSALIAASKRRQTVRLTGADTVSFPPPSRREHTLAGFQGVVGAWGEIAATALYPDRELRNYPYFEDVFEAVARGEVGWGVLPIENSKTGAVGEVYDLLRRHGCFIVGQTWVDIRHCLMAKPGTSLSDIREVLSHPEGLRQCHHFLKKYAWDKVGCTNTAIAAETVAARADNRCAAVGSRRAAQRHGLEILAPDIMDDADNRTRFIAIAPAPWYDEHSDAVSVTFSTAHRAGALCRVLETFMAADVNLTRIESRPVSGGKYRFFADLQGNVLDPRCLAALNQAAAQCEYFEVLGCYRV